MVLSKACIVPREQPSVVAASEIHSHPHTRSERARRGEVGEGGKLHAQPPHTHGKNTHHPPSGVVSPDKLVVPPARSGSDDPSRASATQSIALVLLISIVVWLMYVMSVVVAAAVECFDSLDTHPQPRPSGARDGGRLGGKDVTQTEAFRAAGTTNSYVPVRSFVRSLLSRANRGSSIEE